MKLFFMSSKSTNFTERTDVQSILFLLLISSMLTFILPFFLFYYISDVFVVIGMTVGSYVVLKKEKKFKERVNYLLRLVFIGGILTGIDLSSVLILIARSENKAFKYPLTFLFLLTSYIILTLLIIAGLIIGYLYFVQSDYFNRL